MPGWKDHFKKTVSNLEEKWDELRFQFNKKMGWNDPVQIVTFRTYGTARKVYIKGRVLEDKKIASAGDKDSVFDNILNMYKRFESDEVPGAKLKVVLGDQIHEVVSDLEGYFILDLHLVQPVINEQLWYTIPLELTSSPVPGTEKIGTNAEVMIPPPEAEFGIISDIDDTIVKTNATSLLAMSRMTFFNNAKTRLPFAGVAEFYKSLQLGKTGKRNNPFFYVSSSPWNLYDLLIEFLDINSIPAGPLLLRDFGFDHKKENSDHMGHKFKEITQILETYPQLNFVLIGDSGQEDPNIYSEVVKQFPGRILAIYIRDVQLLEKKKIAFDVSQSLSDNKIEMVIVENTLEAARHALKIGLIDQECIGEIEREKKEDNGEAGRKEKA
jgi:phosphatidate phosphatase APP1